MGMTVRAFSASAFGLLLLSAAATAAEWDYEGEHGPRHWATISPENAACGGAQQSPIDLVPTHAGKLQMLLPSWKSVTPVVLNNGHTIQANAAPGSFTRLGDTNYALLQVHFHAESEHTILGTHFPVEAHFVHKGPDGNLMVMGVMIEEGAANPVLGAIWDAAPASTGEAKTSQPLDLASLLPDNSRRFQYAGSLTTPPCSEIVNWNVFTSPITASAEQIGEFEKLYSDNFRPVQKLNRRFVLLGD